MATSRVVDNGTSAVNGAEVAVVYKTDVAAAPPAVAYCLLAVIPRGVGKPQSPQFRFDLKQDRDDFYTKIVAAMG